MEYRMEDRRYQTHELELASFLKARGHEFLNAQLRGKLVEFHFDASAEKAAEDYFAGAKLSARELFEAHRGLRTLIQQLKEHNAQIGSDKSCQRSSQKS
jgi:hypothetical protein